MVAGTARAGANGGSPLSVSGEGFVARVTLIRPERRNALNVMPLLALEKASSDLRQAAGVGVVVPSGAASSFCAGVDMEEVRREFYEPPQQIERLYQKNGQEVVGGGGSSHCRR